MTQKQLQMSKKFKRGDSVRKKGNKGQWHGIICGEYSTDITSIGYAVESVLEKGSVQIYPESALEPVNHYPDNLTTGFVISGPGIIHAGRVSPRRYLEECFDQGNWSATGAEAELEVKRRAVIQKMRSYGFVPDWSIRGGNKFSLKSGAINGLVVDCWAIQGLGLFEVYFKTRERAQACIDALGTEILEVLT